MFNDLVDIDVPFLSHFSIATLLDLLQCYVAAGEQVHIGSVYEIMQMD